MPLEPEHLIDFLNDPTNERRNADLMDLTIARINKLCFEECQIDRIACTLTPMCTRRFLLKLRMINGLGHEDLPKFCYKAHKNMVQRDFEEKTVIYKPFDSYLYLIDFLDIFFHADYRKLNKFISFKNWEDVLNLLEEKVQKTGVFNYHLSENKNYFIFLYEEKLHIVFVEEGYVLTNARRESVASLELLKGIFKLFSNLFFPDIKVKQSKNSHITLKTIVPKDIISRVEPFDESKEDSEEFKYFHNIFHTDIGELMHFCERIRLKADRNENLEIKLYLDLLTNNYNERNKQLPLRYRDIFKIKEFLEKLYNNFYILWLDQYPLNIEEDEGEIINE
ncbi:MAG: hypothetical protein ACOC44_19965 [Promethearchaeia archaeon]